MNAGDQGLYALARSVIDSLRASGLRAAAAESCTGGWIAKAITDVPGSSDCFTCGLVTYSDQAKTRLLGVDAALIEAHGAVSEPVVQAMATGAMALPDVDVAVAVSGVAGPGGGSAEKPVGTVCIAWAGRERVVHSERLHFDGDREQIRRLTVQRALLHLLNVAGE